MRTTILLDDELLEEAKSLSGIQKTSHIITVALSDYVKRQNNMRLALLYGSQKDSDISAPNRRKL